MFVGRRTHFISCFALLVLWSGVAGAEERGGCVVFVRVGDAGLGDAREAKTVEELSLVLDGLEVVELDRSETGFLEWSIAQQVDELSGVALECDPLAAVWIQPRDEAPALINLVSLRVGRAVTRIVEVEAVAGDIRDIALVVRELLGEAFLFHRTADDVEIQPALERVVEEVRREVAGPADASAHVARHSKRGEASVVDPPDRRTMVLVQAEALGGVGGDVGPSVLMGGRLTLDRELIGPFGYQVSLGGDGGFLEGSGGDFEAWRVNVALALRAYLEWRRLVVGPAVGLRIIVSGISVQREVRDAQRFTHTWYELEGRLDIGLRLTEALRLTAGGGLVVAPVREAFYLSSNQKIVLRTPLLGWEALLGLAIGW